MHTTGGGIGWDWAGGMDLKLSVRIFPEQIAAYARMLEALACRDIGLENNILPPFMLMHWECHELAPAVIEVDRSLTAEDLRALKERWEVRSKQ